MARLLDMLRSLLRIGRPFTGESRPTCESELVPRNSSNTEKDRATQGSPVVLEKLDPSEHPSSILRIPERWEPGSPDLSGYSPAMLAAIG